MRFFRRSKDPGACIDAIAEIENHQAQFEGRDPPDLAGSARPTPPGARAFMVLLLLSVIMLLVTLTWQALSARAKQDENKTIVQAKIENLLPALNLRAERTPDLSAALPPEPVIDEPPLALPLAVTPVGADLAEESGPQDPLTRRRLTSGLQSDADMQARQNQRAQSVPGDRDSQPGPMSERLAPSNFVAARASILKNRDMLITQGAMIDCLQETKFVSGQAGMLTCHAVRDVRSTSGRVVLVDAGTKFVGYQQSVLAHGQPRIGVIWSRLETPQGVVVQLDSPGAGPLGEAGLDGHIDTHFAERFGGAILVSLLSDMGEWAKPRGSGGGNGVRFDATSDAASNVVTTVLDHSINIPPTLYRNQGRRLGIFVARDLDFSSVYALIPVAP